MKIIDTQVSDVKVIEPQVFADERGFFMETYRTSWLQELGVSAGFVQDNHSKSIRGTLRGLHYQINNPQGKLVRVTQGEVYDVAVDIRQSSPTFGQWAGKRLSESNKLMMWVPSGFAHGFMVLSDTAEFLYKCTTYYSPQDERAIVWNDSELNIDWPTLEIEPILSEKDANAASFKNAEYF